MDKTARGIASFCPLSQKIMEECQVRRSANEKAAFISLLKNELSPDYPLTVEESGGRKGKHKNIIIGRIEEAELVFTAHYDTPPAMPAILRWRFRSLKSIPYKVGRAVLVLMLLALYGALTVLGILFIIYILSVTGTTACLIFVGVQLVLAAIAVIIILKFRTSKNANPVNYNDNTSGVVTIIEALHRMSECSAEVAFVLFDNEEKGTLGSKAFYKQHKEKLKCTPVLNFDCVATGELYSASKKKVYQEKGLMDFLDAGGYIRFLPKWRLSVHSDNNRFPMGIAFTSLVKRGKWNAIVDKRVHSPKDGSFINPENIQYLAEYIQGCCKKLQFEKKVGMQSSSSGKK